jgi:hypothetical protein
MGGQDPEKYGPIRSLLAYYAKKPHIFTSCVRDNRKRFGPRVNNVCAWVKDQIKGTTYWRGHETQLREMLVGEGMTEADIHITIYDMASGTEMDMPPGKDVACEMCDNLGVDYDPDGYDSACPDCGDWCDCDCEGMSEALDMHNMKRQMHSMMTEAKAGSVEPDPIMPTGTTPAEKKQVIEDLKAKDAEASKNVASSGSGSKKKKSGGTGAKNPREVARPENGTVVYDDGSIKDLRTGLAKYPVHVYQDGSVRYDDGSVARPGSLASLLVIQPMSKEDRARLFAAGPAGLPMKDFASVEQLIDSVAKQAYAKAGVGGMGELAVDPLAQQQSMAGALSPASMAMVIGQSGNNLPNSKVASPGASAAAGGVDPNDMPIKPMRGEDIVRGPEGGRGVWRTVDKTPVFIKIGQSPNQAREERRARANSQKQ